MWNINLRIVFKLYTSFKGGAYVFSDISINKFNDKPNDYKSKANDNVN